MSLQELATQHGLVELLPTGFNLRLSQAFLDWLFNNACNLTPFHEQQIRRGTILIDVNTQGLEQDSSGFPTGDIFQMLWTTPRHQLPEHIVDALVIAFTAPVNLSRPWCQECSCCEPKERFFGMCYRNDEVDSKGCANCILLRCTSCCEYNQGIYRR